MKWLWPIVGSLIVAGIGAVVTVTYAGAKTSAATEERVHAIAVRVDEHDAELREVAKDRARIERIDERVLDVVRRLERIDSKLDAPRGQRR